MLSQLTQGEKGLWRGSLVLVCCFRKYFGEIIFLKAGKVKNDAPHTPKWFDIHSVYVYSVSRLHIGLISSAQLDRKSVV